MKKYDQLNEEWDKIEEKIKRKFIRIANGMFILPAALISTPLKYYREKMDSVVKRNAIGKKIYHFTSAEAAERIMKSGYLKAGKGISYGSKCVNAFLGMPLLENLVKNLNSEKRDDLVFLSPDMVMNAIEISPEIEDMRGWSVRPLSDSAIIIEGAYLLPIERTKSVQIGFDLKRDEQGTPVFDYDKKRYTIEPRVLTEKDFNEQGKYIPQPDYLEAVQQQAKELGYETNGKRRITNSTNKISVDGKYEVIVAIKNLRHNLKNLIKRMRKTPELLATTEERVQNELENNAFNTTNPNKRVQKVTRYAGKIMFEEGICQESVGKLLNEINSTEIGQFFRKKVKAMDLSGIPEQGLHGLSHNNNTAMLGLRIAQKQGILENDKDNRLKDIITTALYYHDLGRVRMGIAFNYGRHAKRSVKKLKGRNISFLNGEPYSENDMNILKLLIEGHETKSDEEFGILAEKYNIQESEIDMVSNLFNIIKDADALHRVRIDKVADMIPIPGIRGSVDLNFDYLRSSEAKSLIFAAYELDSLSRKVPTNEFTELLKYGTEEKMKDSRGREIFVNSLEVSREVKAKIEEVVCSKVKSMIKGYRKRKQDKKYIDTFKKLKNIIKNRKKKAIEFFNDESGFISL